MKAVVYHDYGDPSVLTLADRPEPRLLPGQVLIEVAAASVNPIDYRLRQGEMKGILPGGFPRIPGYDVAGVIVDNGGDDRFTGGDRVAAFLDQTRGGGYAEFAACAVSSVAKIPDSMPLDEAAAIPLAGTTALQSLRDHGQMQPGNRVLVNGASGGVGMFAVQIAVAYGCQVDAVASGPKEQFCRSLGAERFFDYKQVNFTETEYRWDLIFDAAGKSSYRESRRVLNKGGRYVSTEPSVSGALMSIATWPLSKSGRVMLAKPSGSDLRELIDLVQEGKIKITIDRHYALSEAAEAHRRIESGVEHGKIVLLNKPAVR